MSIGPGGNRMTHFLVLRLEHGFGSGPGSGYQEPDTIEIMAASRTRAGAERAQKRLGGWIEKSDGPFRSYEQNEFLRYAKA